MDKEFKMRNIIKIVIINKMIIVFETQIDQGNKNIHQEERSFINQVDTNLSKSRNIHQREDHKDHQE